MARMTLAVHSQLFNIHSFPSETAIPDEVFQQSLYFIGKTADELSIVLPAEVNLPSQDKEEGWSCLEIVGPLDLTMTGVLSQISGILAKADVSIFVVSTFDTDYILVKQEKLLAATSNLKKNNYQIVEWSSES